MNGLRSLLPVLLVSVKFTYLLPCLDISKDPPWFRCLAPKDEVAGSIFCWIPKPDWPGRINVYCYSELSTFTPQLNPLELSLREGNFFQVPGFYLVVIDLSC